MFFSNYRRGINPMDNREEVGFPAKVYSTERVKTSEGKSDSLDRHAQPPTKCSNCNSTKTWKAGFRKTNHGDLQRYLCRECGFRFSVDGRAKSFYMESGKGPSYQIGAVPNAHGQVINLVAIEPLKEEGLAGATTQLLDSKGKILEYAWWQKKNGKSEYTIKG